MNPIRTARRARGAALLTGLLAAAFALPSRADEVYVLAPGPEGEDSSYYSFIPLLIRGNYTTMYAHTALDDQGVSHSMESFLRFQLPQDLLLPGEQVLEASLIMVFAFSFDHGGTPPAPGGELAISRVTQPWSESTLNYANHPASAAPFEVLTGIDDFGPVVFDVTGTVSSWATGATPNYGFKLSNPFDNPIGFHTFEADVDPSLKAQLVIVVPEPAPIAALIAGILMLLALHELRRSAGSARGTARDAGAES